MKKPINPKFIFFLFVLAFIAVFAIAIIPTKQNPPSSSPSPTVRPTREAASPPLDVRIANAPANVAFIYNGSLPSLPSELPIYRASWPNSITAPDLTIENTAQKLGFGVPQEQTITTDVSTILWNSPDGSLSYHRSGTIRTIAYQQYRPTTSVPAPALVSDTIATFARDTLLHTTTLRLVQQEGARQQFEGLVLYDSPAPKLTSYLFSYATNEGIPLLLTNYNPIAASAVVDASGRIRSLSYTFPPTTLVEEKIVPILTLDEAVGGLNAGRGILLSVASNEKQIWGAAPAFSSVNLASVSFAYLPQNGGATFVPVFLFFGNGLGTDGKLQPVEYLLMASPQL